MPSALQTLQTPVIKEWIDYNGHLNDANYLVIFTKASDALQNHLGLTLEHIQNTGETLFTVETHLAYVQEIGLGETVTITTQMLETDNKPCTPSGNGTQPAALALLLAYLNHEPARQ